MTKTDSKFKEKVNYTVQKGRKLGNNQNSKGDEQGVEERQMRISPKQLREAGTEAPNAHKPHNVETLRK